jgi:DNA-binding NarL/FixJ family response regulator
MGWEAINKQLGFHKNKYQHTTKYIVKTLEITESEQRKLKVLIGADEKRHRNTTSRRTKRREDGVQARDNYDKERQAKVSVKASEALRLRLDGMSVRAIAEQMECSVGSVHGYLKKSQEMT